MYRAQLEFPYNNDELFEDDCEDDTDVLSIDTEDECTRKEVLEVRNLDHIMRAMYGKIKKANEKTLLYQCENRKRLEKMLTLSPFETGKLAENTRQFFYLCPGYKTLNTEIRENDKSCISLETEDSEQQILQNDDDVNFDKICLENVNDEVQEPNNNPYFVNKEITELLLAVEEKVLQQNLYNEQVHPLKEYDDVSNTNSMISISDATSTIKSWQDIDDYLDEAEQEMDESLIVDVAED